MAQSFLLKSDQSIWDFGFEIFLISGLGAMNLKRRKRMMMPTKETGLVHELCVQQQERKPVNPPESRGKVNNLSGFERELCLERNLRGWYGKKGDWQARKRDL